MPEPLTTSLVGELLTKLSAAHPRSLYKANPVHMCDVYRNGLRGLSGDAVRFAVDRAIQDDKDFPKVARLREIATEWERRNRPSVSVVQQAPGANEKYCTVCGAKAEQQEVETRKVVIVTLANKQVRYVDRFKADGSPDLTGKGKEIWEKIISPRTELRHDPRKHGVFVSSGEDT